MMVRLAILFALLGGAASGEDLTMSLKERIFQDDMQARFMLDGQALCKMKLPRFYRHYIAYEMPDNAYMTGLYLGMLAMKYQVTKDPAIQDLAHRSIQALHLLCTVSGRPGLLARTAWPKDRPWCDEGKWWDSPDGIHKWRRQVSVDQIDGVMFGASLAYALVANDQDKETLAADMRAMVDYVLQNDLRIIDINGKPTRWGKYYPEFVRDKDPMPALFWLQALKVAHQLTGDAKYEALYRKYAIDEGYAKYSPELRSMDNPNKKNAVNHSDDVLLFLAWETLLRLETDPALRDLYLKGFRRMWEGDGKYPGVKPEGNPLYAVFAAKYLGDDSGVKPAIDTLRWFPLDMKVNHDTVKKFEKRYHFTYDPAPKSPEPAPGMPIPIDRRIKTWSAWVQDCYKPGLSGRGDWYRLPEGCKRTKDLRMEFNGHDYLLAYWFGRYNGCVPQD
jgi:hypothetical protein